MPFVYNNEYEQLFGIRKVWLHPLGNNINSDHFGYEAAILKGHYSLFKGLVLDTYNFKMQIAIAVMVTLISLQAEIFDSSGY